MLGGQEAAGAAEAGLDLVEDEHRPGLAAGGLRALEIARRWQVDALALDRLDDERGDVARRELRAQRVEVAERDLVAARHQRAEPLAELRVAVDRQGAGRQAMERVVAVEDPRAPGRAARELDRGLDRLGARVGVDDRVEPGGGARHELLGQHARQQRQAHRGERRRVGHERGDQLLAHAGVIAAQREHPEPRQQVEPALAGVVDQVGALAAHPGAVVAERAQDAAELRVEVAVVQRGRFAGALGEDGRDVHDPRTYWAVGRLTNCERTTWELVRSTLPSR